jgi:hypothetical protein
MDFFPTAERGLDESTSPFYLCSYISIYAFYFVLLKCLLMKYFKVLRNKIPDENPDLPMDF